MTEKHINVFKCCMDNGEYLGSPWIHDPSVPADGPWYLSIKDGDSFTEFGFGTKKEALVMLAALNHPDEYTVEIDPWE